jgi:hypothetical protein
MNEESKESCLFGYWQCSGNVSSGSSISTRSRVITPLQSDKCDDQGNVKV